MNKFFQKIGTNLYFHIPFCFKKCNYCYFFSLERQKEKEINRYLDYLEKEIILKKQKWYFPKKIKTVYIGGGTPSLLSLSLLKKLFAILKKHFQLENGKLEFTVEINPSFCSKKKLFFFKKEGVNRLSFGIQTVDQKILKLIGRIFYPKRAKKIIQYAKNLNFEVINLDFMFRLPGQNLKSLKSDISFIKKINPTSVYWYETKNVTGFMKKIERDQNQSCYQKMDEFIEKKLKKINYQRLMTEFYTKNGKPCQYTVDWLFNDYVVSFGPFAISKIKNRFYKNISNLKLYYQFLKGNTLPIIDSFSLNKKEYAATHFAYLIRFGEINLDSFNKKFKLKIENLLKEEIFLLKKYKFLKQKGRKIFLTHKGLVYTPDVQIVLLNKYKHCLKNLNFFLGRGYNLK